MQVLRKMCTALAIATAFMIFQFVGGYVTGRCALHTSFHPHLSLAHLPVDTLSARWPEKPGHLSEREQYALRAQQGM